jgi:hypothetical protein
VFPELLAKRLRLGRIGASLIFPRARLALNSLKGISHDIGFSLISARFLRRDHPNDLLAAPRVGDPVNFSFDTAKDYEIAARSSPLDHRSFR